MTSRRKCRTRWHRWSRITKPGQAAAESSPPTSSPVEPRKAKKQTAENDLRLTLLLLAAAWIAPAQSTYPLRTPTDDFTPTILDVSAFIEAPTGRHGFVQRRGDQFVFDDG